MTLLPLLPRMVLTLLLSPRVVLSLLLLLRRG